MAFHEANSTSLQSDSIEPKEDLKIIKTISNHRFPIFLAVKNATSFALKMYTNQDDQLNPSFARESRFSFLKHPNIIQFCGTIDRKWTLYQQEILNVSYILIELAQCNFSDLIPLLITNERLVRTFFHQLTAGLDYLHSKNISHMDLKTDNLLLGMDSQLKIADFDGAVFSNEHSLIKRGTKNYRAPEVMNENCIYTEKADIYSVGIVLFRMKFGHLPYIEDPSPKGVDFFDLMLNDPSEFWRLHDTFHDTLKKSDQSFRDLFISLVQSTPEKRPTIEEIMKNDWYKGEVYTPEEVQSIIQENFNFKEKIKDITNKAVFTK